MSGPYMDSNRRDFLQFITGTAISGLTGFGLASCHRNPSSSLPFSAIRPSMVDELILASGLKYSVLVSDGDAISDNDFFGCNNDYTAFIPLSATEGILWVNNEYPSSYILRGHDTGGAKTQEMVDEERYACGGSLVFLEKKEDSWQLKKKSPYNKRVNGLSKIPIISDRPIAGSKVAVGTFANCAGGVTPWGSILTCEENYHDFYGERESEDAPIKSGSLQWNKYYNYPPEHYGWVVEVNPKTGSAKKLTGLGRFAHESATCIMTKSNKLVVYSGDDKNSEFLYKFISDSATSLEKGELFVADLKNGKWLSMSIDKHKILKDNFKDQTDILIHARRAARFLGATHLDRPEDIEIHPKTGDVFVCLTNNKPIGNYHGKILKISEGKGDHASLNFISSDFMVGGKDFSCPDNMIFDKQGHLWVATDISGGAMNKPPYLPFKNNGLFYIPTSGKFSGQVFQVASAPVDAELTGLSFDPKGETLFMSVQHPGEKSQGLDSLTSHWPRGGSSIPKSSVVQITGDLLKNGLKV
jgi:secreted PhoX family phosphatase